MALELNKLEVIRKMIIRKSEREIEIMRKAGSIVAQTHALLAEKVTPGITTGELDKIAEEFILSKGGKPAFKGYQGFPSTLCVAVNEEVVHGFPGNRVLEEGDIIGMDLGVLIDGFYGDSAYTLAVGEISDQAQNLLKVTEESLHQGIEQALEGNRLSDISHAVQKLSLIHI